MTRGAWILVVLAAAGCVVLVNYVTGTHDEAGALTSQHQHVAAMPVNEESTTLLVDNESMLPGDSQQKATLPPPIAAEAIAKLAAEAIGDDSRVRAAAIDALATAPRLQAVPLLQRVLSDGVPSDRQLALNSLRTLASMQGDVGGEIRNVLRLTIYDGDDETVANSAQALLDDIDRDAEPTP